MLNMSIHKLKIYTPYYSFFSPLSAIEEMHPKLSLTAFFFNTCGREGIVILSNTAN